MYVVKLFFECPSFVSVIDKEFQVWRNAVFCQLIQDKGTESVLYYEGCIGLKSMPITLAIGCSSAMITVNRLQLYQGGQSIPKSKAQMPVPVPISRTWSKSLVMGAEFNLLSIIMRKIWCWRSTKFNVLHRLKGIEECTHAFFLSL